MDRGRRVQGTGRDSRLGYHLRRYVLCLEEVAAIDMNADYWPCVG